MVHLRRRPKRTYAGLGLFLSLLLIAGAGAAIGVAGPDERQAPVVEPPAAAAPVELDESPEPPSETKAPKARSGADAKRPAGRRL